MDTVIFLIIGLFFGVLLNDAWGFLEEKYQERKGFKIRLEKAVNSVEEMDSRLWSLQCEVDNFKMMIKSVKEGAE